LRELGAHLPWDRPDPARRDAVRSALLVEAAERSARPATRWYVIGGAFAVGALAAADAVLVLVRSPEHPAAAVSSARVEASPAAQLTRQVTRTPTGIDEVVRVRAGTVSMAVGALRVGDHVRVATRDAEVEGEGSYDVVVVADELRAVTVADGRATIRVTGQQAVFLAAGQSWSSRAVISHADVTPVAPVAEPPAPPEIAIAETRPEPVVHKPVAVAKPRPRELAAQPPIVEPPAADNSVAAPAVDKPVEAPAVVEAPATGPKQVERRFQAGMALLKANQPAEAARELLAAADAGGDDPLAADARYFAATALTKAGRKTEAERALVAFIDRAPNSIRRGRAAVMLARLIAERGDGASARAWFDSALADPDPGVAAAARAGIAALK
jgi:TolA-binding protein